MGGGDAGPAGAGLGSSHPPTMADIAAHLGVSRQLVSLVLRNAPGASEETRRRVREAAQELGFSPHLGARSLRQARSRHLGVLFTPVHATEPEIIESIYPAAAAHDYNVILSAQTPTRTTSQAVEELLGYRCAALVIIGSDLQHAALRSVAQRSPVPVVNVGNGRRNAFYDVVRSSGDRGISDAVAHLGELGHRRITYLHTVSMPPARLRLSGYQHAMKRLGLPSDVVSLTGDYTEEAGSTAARMLLERDSLPTAVVAANDQAAVGLLQVLLRSGVRVPDDMSVTGFDDSRMARLSSVNLTTVRQDPELMGAAAVQAAMRRVERRDLEPRETVVETALVVRGTTATPRPETRSARRA